jgi:hypothetical protein
VIPHKSPKAPDLLELIMQYDGYDQIPQEAWEKWDQAMARYRMALRAVVWGPHCKEFKG